MERLKRRQQVALKAMIAAVSGGVTMPGSHFGEGENET
jgi:hypothetical protein